MSEHFDVLIVGAGISGIGGAYHLLDQCPGTSFVVLENQEGFGGTWRTHTYPGIRSDSDLYTFGYRFKPWTGKPIASAEAIMEYLGEVIDDNGIDQHIRYRHEIRSASWSTRDKQWTIEVEQLDTGERLTFTCTFLWMCQGYYDHKKPFTPEWEGMDDFRGDIVHPQTWPDDLDYHGKKVVVIGSGATAATLIPAMADDTEHITMLQRSPTYFAPRANVDELADQLRSLDVPEEWTHEIVRRNRIKMTNEMDKAAKAFPDMVRDELRAMAREILGDDFDMDTHFTPAYRPWQQRLALIPDGDLFHALKDGKASVVTDKIERFTSEGILLSSGDVLEADIVVTATGFDLSVLGGVTFDIDGEALDFSNTVTWYGAMFSGVPNMVWVFGYFRASWTLKVDLLGDFVARLLHEMADRGASMVVPRLRPEDEAMELKPWIEPDDFNPGYVMRSLHLMPKQGTEEPWRHLQDYLLEKDLLPAADLDDGTLVFD